MNSSPVCISGSAERKCLTGENDKPVLWAVQPSTVVGGRQGGWDHPRAVLVTQHAKGQKDKITVITRRLVLLSFPLLPCLLLAAGLVGVSNLGFYSLDCKPSLCPPSKPQIWAVFSSTTVALSLIHI